ncbi:hypothetical protein ES705_29411 [subsurface metagenome]
MVTEAPMMPTQAARMVPINTVTMASPPLKPPSHRYNASYNRAVIPERSSIRPIKINRGAAKII